MLIRLALFSSGEGKCPATAVDVGVALGCVKSQVNCSIGAGRFNRFSSHRAPLTVSACPGNASEAKVRTADVKVVLPVPPPCTTCPDR
ncbi:hypothetical protein [Synechococcus sp. UW179A]|uniref:hypothetical protein n=1 Tax=Synechococcus sp. UW179A TaxID=2575510 RepID=UPI001FCAFEA9|nr:hypothetical protein [Synechococcus sp. UW179A]